MAQISDVESILNKLNKLEEDIERINSLVEEMRKKLLLFAEQEIEALREELINNAKKEAENIINNAKKEAEGEANRILLDADRNVTIIENNVKKMFNEAVEKALRRIISG